MTTVSRLYHGVFPGLELNVNDLQARIGSLKQEYSTKLSRYQGSLGREGLQGEVRLSRRPHVTFWWFCVRWSDTARDTWQDGEGRGCRFVSIDKERKQNAVNFKRDFLLHAAEKILRSEVNDEAQARVGRWTRDGWWTKATRKEHSQQQARKEHSQQQAERTRRSASPTSSQGVW